MAEIVRSARVRGGLAAIAAAVVLVVPGAATAVTRGPDPAKPFFDSRTAERQAAAGRPVAASARERAARERLGRRAAVTLDPLTGTARSLQRLDGALTGPAAGDRSTVALRWVRDNRAALGITAADVDALTLADRSLAPATGITHLRYRQSYRGIPAFDNGLRVNLDRGGRILNVTGAPVSGLRVDSIAPALDAVAAMRALQRNVGVERAIDVTSGPAGDRRLTHFAGGEFARLVLFGTGHGARLAWHLTYRATSTAYYDAVVDATSAAILYRQNLTKSDARADVFPNHPGAGPAVDSDFAGEGWLDEAATTLEGDFVHAYSDEDDDGFGQEIGRTPGDDFNWPFNPFASPPHPANGCTLTALCSWEPSVADSWEANRKQNAVQAFYFANTFRDHLAGSNIGFDGFAGADKLHVQTDDGAATGNLNNANMSTPPDGMSPVMQMYLFAYDEDDVRFRSINGGDSAAVVWHEYTHGLSNRLIIHDDGTGALSSPHAGAMGEGWSDWYALDLLFREGLEVDDPGPGEVDVGHYTDAVPGALRSEPIDCAPTDDVAVCPGGQATGGRGGYTLGDFGHVLGFPEEHADGEIWTQTLWDLRARLIDDLGGEVAGSNLAEKLITEGMRLSPPEPSFLDGRNAILAAAVALGVDRTPIWQVFAQRGMGFFAAATSSSDVAPREDFNPPPPPGSPMGRIAGTVSAAESGLPLANVTVGLAGLSASSPSADEVPPATTAPDGSYSLVAPAGRYGGLVYTGSGGFEQLVVTDADVPANATSTRDVALRRDWAARSGGGDVLIDDDLYDNTGALFGCGLTQLIDQSHGSGWSPFNPASPDAPGLGSPKAVIELPRTIDVTAFGLDPTNTCGDDETATTKDYRIETSADGVSFAPAGQGSFTYADRNRRNIVEPTANARNVRFVRLTLLTPQDDDPGDSGRDFIDFSELEVFGSPPNLLPGGPLQVSAATVLTGQPVTLDASQVTDPDSKITGYDWDFDGNGTVDRTTAAPATSFAYTSGGTFTAKVAVKDFRGGAGTATRQIAVAAPPAVTLPRRGSKGKVTARVACSIRCTVKATLTLSKRQARALRVKKRAAGTLRKTITRTGAQSVAPTLSRRVRRAAKRRRIKRVKATLSVTVTYAVGRPTTKRRVVTIRL